MDDRYEGTETLEELDALIENEQRRLCCEVIDDAWAEIVSEGVEPDMAAEAMVDALTRRLLAEIGAKDAQRLLEAATDALDGPDYLPATSIH